MKENLKIRYFSEKLVNETIHTAATAIAIMQKKEKFGGIFVIHEMPKLKKEKPLNCWNFSFGSLSDEKVIELSDECMTMAMSLLEKTEISFSSTLGLEHGGISNSEAGLVFASQGLAPIENGVLATIVAFQLQCIPKSVLMESPGSHLIAQLLQEFEIGI